MKDIKQWISFFVYLMIWIFSFKLFDLFVKYKGYSDKELTKLCIGGLLFFGLIYNSDYIKYE